MGLAWLGQPVASFPQYYCCSGEPGLLNDRLNWFLQQKQIEVLLLRLESAILQVLQSIEEWHTEYCGQQEGGCIDL